MNHSTLRAWQAEALAKYDAADPRDFLTTATPGAGKTTFALAIATRLMTRRLIDRVVVVAPTDHLRTQWAAAASQVGLALDPNLPNSVGPVRQGSNGYVTTYAQVAAKPLLHRGRTESKRTLVILDEIHHAGDTLSWGDAVREAFDPAKRRLSLTGTPFRTKPQERIPFVHYTRVGDDEIMSEADYIYGYREALADGVVRPVVFAAYAGTSRWMNSAGEVLSASLGEDNTKSVEEAAWRTALDPAGAWVPHVIAAIHDRVMHLRQAGIPDAAGLILASDQDAARAYAKIAKKVTGVTPVLILSDDPKASKKIRAFEHGTEPLAVCVRMVSEGVDIPRAAALGWLTSYRTPLFFAQAVGRVVRGRAPHETATVFLPAVRPLLALAAALEEQRDHVVRLRATGSDDLDDLELAEREMNERLGPTFQAVGAEAEFAHVLHAGRAITAEPRPVTAEEEDFLGLPGLLTPEQTAQILAARDQELRKRTQVMLAADDGPHTRPSEHWEDVAELRRTINKLVAQVAARTGRRHAEVHVDVRRAVPGPPTASASAALLQARYEYLLSR